MTEDDYIIVRELHTCRMIQTLLSELNTSDRIAHHELRATAFTLRKWTGNLETAVEESRTRTDEAAEAKGGD